MASIIERGPFQFQVQIRRKNYPTQSKTFETRREAEQTTLGEALERYKREVTACKKAPKREENRITAWIAHPLAKRSLANLRSTDFAQYRDQRAKSVGGNSIRLELAVISHLFTIARKDWNIPVDNPIKNIRMPELPPASATSCGVTSTTNKTPSTPSATT